MIAIEDNVEQLCTARAKQAMADYKAGIADEGRGRERAIQAIIAYGHALQEGRKDRSNQAFAKWVSDNGLDVGDPWSDRVERTQAMTLADVVRGIGTTDAFAACPNTRPTNIMKWYRKMHPEPRQRREAISRPKIDKALEEGRRQQAEGRKPTRGTLMAEAQVADHPAQIAIAVLTSETERFGGDDPLRVEVVDCIAAELRKVSGPLPPAAVAQVAQSLAALPEIEAARLADAKFSPKGKVTIADAIRIHKERLSKQFEQAVNTEVRKRIDTADDHVRKSNKEMSARLLLFEMERGKKGVFSPGDYNLILKCLDSSAIAFRLKEPDPELVRRFDEAIALVRNNKDRLVRSV